MENLLTIMRRLRAPDGCPWDQKQTHESLRPYLLEEAAEAVDAVGSPQELAAELGDVLLQVAFHSVIAQENGEFSYEDVETHIVDKLVRRHPHVFADTQVADADEVVTNWNAIKAQERGGEVAEHVPHGLPALMRAAELAKLRNWNTSSAQALTLLCERLQPDAQSIGTLLAELASYAQANGVNPELALRDTLKVREA